MEASLAEAMDDRRASREQLTAGPRRLAVAADSELRRRDPGKSIEPLRSAEPRVPENDEITTPMAAAMPAEPPEWVTKLAGQRGAFQDKLAERQNVMVPDEESRLWVPRRGVASDGAQRDAILQPPKPEVWPCRGVERSTGYQLSDGYELPDKEATG